MRRKFFTPNLCALEPPQQAPETFNRVGRREFCASSAMSYAWLSTGLQWLQRRGRSGRSLASLLAIVAVSDLIFHISSFIGGVAQGQVIARLALCSKDFFQAVRQLAPLPLLEIRRAINLSHLRWMILKGGPCVQTIDASHTDDLHVTDDILALIAEKCQGVLEVSLTENKRISNAGLVSLCQGCSALQQITLRGLWISDMGLIVASPHLGCLTHIDLMNCSSVTDIGVAAIAEYCHLLTSVDLSHIVEITDASIRALAGHCQRLEHICAVRCARIGDSSCLSLGEGECRRKRDASAASWITKKNPTALARTGLVSRDPPSLAEPTRCPRVTFLVSPRKTVSCIQTKSYFALVATRIQRVAGDVALY